MGKNITNLCNLITEFSDFMNNGKKTLTTEFELLKPIVLNDVDSITAFTSNHYCYVSNHYGAGWFSVDMLSDDIIELLYKAISDLWDSEVEKNKLTSTKEKFNELFESRKAEIFEFSTDGALQHILGRDNSVKMLQLSSFETLANKYLDACDIIAKMKTFVTNL